MEQLVTSINHDKTNNSLFMKCSLKNTEKEIKFCRFLRLIDDVGLNLDEGHGTTKYRFEIVSFKHLFYLTTLLS